MENQTESIFTLLNRPIVHIGETPVTFGGIGTAIVVFFVTLIISSIVQKIIFSRLKKSGKMNLSMIFALNRILHYVILVVGVVLASQCIGLNFGTLAVAFGFLGVGVGLGLQNLTSNFVSGLILLIERPIGIGDWVDIDGKIAEVKTINMRATVVRTLDNVTVIIPNAKFIENNVINWSVEDPRVRLHCPVGVAYGSDVDKVKKILVGVAHEHGNILKEPAPEVRFLEFGDSSLNFDLLIWTDCPQSQIALRSDVNFMIDRAFRENAVQIPFPQRDVHIKMTPEVERVFKKEEKI